MAPLGRAAFGWIFCSFNFGEDNENRIFFFPLKSVNLLFPTRPRILNFRIVQRFRKHVYRRDDSQAGSGRGSPSCAVGIRARSPAPVRLLPTREAPSEGTEWEGKGEAVALLEGVRAVALGSL